MLKILYIGGVGPFGGSTRSLYEALRAIPPGTIDPYFIVQRGPAAKFFRELARDVITTRGLTRFDHTRASHYRGARWLVLLRELFHLPFTLTALLRARRRWGTFDLIHVNDITEIVTGLIAKLVFRGALVVHVRSPVVTDRRMLRTRWLHRRLRLSVDAIVAIDESVRARLPAQLPVSVIHNSFTPEPSGEPDPAFFRQFDGLRPTALKVGFVGNLYSSKGVFELLQAAGIVRDAGQDVQFIVVGGGTAPERGIFRWLLKKLGLAQNIGEHIRDRIRIMGLEKDFVLFGATSDIGRVYPRMDVLAFPSHLDSPGRPVFEAAFFGVPSIVAVRDPQADTLVDGETAIAIPEPDPRQIAEAVIRFSSDRSEAARMGRNARLLAERNFRPHANALELLALYRQVAPDQMPRGDGSASVRPNSGSDAGRSTR